MIGATPVAALSDWRYVAVSLPAGLLIVLLLSVYRPLERLGADLRRRGSGPFRCYGRATKALAYHLNPVAAALFGMLTGVAGGMMRDVLMAEVPMVLRADLYAVAALAGAAVVVIAPVLNIRSAAAMTVGALLCFGLRFMAIRYGWSLPVAVGVRRP